MANVIVEFLVPRFQVESDMAEFEASVAAMEADLDQRMAPHKPGLPDWALPPATLPRAHSLSRVPLLSRPPLATHCLPLALCRSPFL